MVQLVLGIDDVAYADPSGGGVTTTGDVAEILESRYHVMEIFWEEHREEIGEWLSDALADQIQDMANGAPISNDPFLDAEQNIEASFRDFIETGEIEKISPDTPTQAALEGRTKRRKNQKGPRRVSFRDTGLYVRSFRARVEDWQSEMP